MAITVASSIPSCSYANRSLSKIGEALGTLLLTSRKLWKPLPKGAVARGRNSSLVMQAGSGFGKRSESKTMHKILTLDISKAESVETFTIFVRKTSSNGDTSKWEKVGEILLESSADVEVALKERRKKLNAAVRYQYPLLTVLKAGQDLEYGVVKSSDTENTIDKVNEDIVLVDLRGKEPEISVPAILRADDGIKVPTRSYLPY